MHLSCRVALAVALVGGGVCLGATPALAGPPTSDGVSVAEFSTDYQGCAGPLRSLIASGAIAGVQVGDLVVPDGFGQGFNPGAHLGSVDEIAFIEQTTGLDRAGVEALCDSLAKAAH